MDVARVATFAENAIWMLWRKHDPITGLDMVRMRQVKQETGKWPKLEPYKLEKTPEGETPTTIAKALCPGLPSCIYDAIANQVAKLYMKNRFAYLNFSERLPMGRDLRIRFREKATQIRRDPENPQFFQIGLKLTSPEPGKTTTVWFGLKLRGCSEWTYRWLDDLASTGNPVSGGTISARKKRGRTVWQIALARPRMEGERKKVHPVPGRELICWAPPDADECLWCEVSPRKGKPWRLRVESNDMVLVKKAYERTRRHMGRNYHQSPYNSAHGHGRRRAIQGKERFSGRYNRRVKDWIENRSAAIVRFAVDARCETIRFEELTKRDPKTLRLGSFPYYQLISRIQQKAKDAGIAFKLFEDISSLEARLKNAG